MVSWLAAGMGKIMYKVGEATLMKTVKYGSDAAGGAIAYNQLHQVKKSIEQQIKVPYLGHYVGAAVAGYGLPIAKEQANRVSTAIFDLSKQAIETTIKEGQSIEATNVTTQIAEVAAQTPVPVINRNSYLNTAVKTATTVAPILVGVALAAGAVPAVSASLTLAAINSFPKIFGALTTKVDYQKENVNLVDDVFTPVAKQVLFKTAGVAANGIARFSTVVNSYETRLKIFEQVPRGLTAWAPSYVQNFVGNAGWLAGKIEAPRYAMSDAVIQTAIENGDYAEKVTLAGLDMVDFAAQLAIKNNTEKTYWTTAKNTGIIALAVMGGAAFVALTPEAAALTCGTALLGVTDKAITWVKLQLTPEQVALQGINEKEDVLKTDEVKLEMPAKDKELTMEFFDDMEFHFDDHFILPIQA